MAYVVNESCIRCKLQDCVEVCPVDCFHEGANMLVIDPESCIDCGVCEPECPLEAVLPDSDEQSAPWVDLNASYARVWPSIISKGQVPADEAAFRDVSDKFEKFFDPTSSSKSP